MLFPEAEILRPRFLQGLKSGVGGAPKSEEAVVRLSRRIGVSLQHRRTREAEMRQRVLDRCRHLTAMVNDGAKLTCRSTAILQLAARWRERQSSLDEPEISSRTAVCT